MLNIIFIFICIELKQNKHLKFFSDNLKHKKIYLSQQPLESYKDLHESA